MWRKRTKVVKASDLRELLAEAGAELLFRYSSPEEGQPAGHIPRRPALDRLEPSRGDDVGCGPLGYLIV